MSRAGSRRTLVWAITVGLSLLSFGAPNVGGLPFALVAAVVAIAGIKAAVIGLEFMELREAPRGLRLAYVGWTVAVTTALVLLLWER